MPTNDDDYTIGFGKPPKNTRFAKGQSGNPAGRPKGSQNFGTIIDKACREIVEVSRGGRVRRISKFEAAMLQVTNKAAAGDLRAIRDLQSWLISRENLQQPSAPPPVATENDRIVVANLVQRIRQSRQSATELVTDPKPIKKDDEDK